MVKVSVIIPAFNEELYIKDCLNSFDYNNENYTLEVIIVDDQSADNTFGVVSNYIESNSNVKIYKNLKKGKVSAYNFAFSKATGEYILLVGADDLLVPEILWERVQPLLHEKTKPAVSLCKIKTFSNSSKYSGLVFPKNPGKGAECGGAMLFNRKFADLAFPINESLPNEDTILKLILNYCNVVVKHVPKVGLLYRQHDGNSVKLGAPFEVFSVSIARRHRAYSLFYHNSHHLIKSEKGIEEVKAYMLVENYRVNNRFIKMCFIKSLPIKVKLSFILQSNKYFFAIRKTLYRFLAGS